MSDCQHEPLIADNPVERDLDGVVAVDDRRQVLPAASRRIWPCKHCGAALDVGHDPRRRVTRSWLIEHGYPDPFFTAPAGAAASEAIQPLQNLGGEGVASEPRHGKGSLLGPDAPSPTRRTSE